MSHGWWRFPHFSEPDASALRATVREEGVLTSGYVLMSALSAGIATLGLLQSSSAVVIGAMLVSPLMSPIAALGFGFASLDGHNIKDAVRVVIIGALIGILTGMLVTWLSPIRNVTPEIIARTQPTLLDLAIALLSGIAGGYATVRQKGGTAIGVAIATALMPPLATIGYGLGVANWEFAGGALLLFLTNLAAIAFSFAFIARLSGVARPLGHVELTPRYIAAGILVFVALATPLGLTLVRVSKEARARGAARSVLTSELHVTSGKIAQLEVRWPLMRELSIDAVVITPVFLPGAQRMVDLRLFRVFGVTPNVSLQQIVAADDGSQTRAMIDAAMERTTAGLAKDVPPYDAIRNGIGLPIQSMWVDRGARIVHVSPADAPGWTLGDYLLMETAARASAGEWKVQVVPPTSRTLEITFPPTLTAPDTLTEHMGRVAQWALERWGVSAVQVEITRTAGDSAALIAQRRLSVIVNWLASGKIAATGRMVDRPGKSPDTFIINPFAPSPSSLAGRVQPALQRPN